ncbi:MAG: EAL domain-containing protein, partial [Lachnospiraceae bacterium]|nr:EAL domain-containing protein [Lachnospiraceae bacterium]
MEKYRYQDEAKAALEGLEQPLAVYQLIDGRIVTLVVSDGFCRLFGYEDRSLAVYDMDHDMYKDTHPDDREKISDAAWRFAEGGEDYDAVFRTKAGVDSDYQVIHAHGKHVFTESGIRLAHVWYMDEGRYIEGDEASGTKINRELNSILREESIIKTLRYDVLTGLPNLAYFFKLCEIGKARVFREGKQGALLYMDLYGMKYFNDRNGFAEGDRLLKSFASLLSDTFGHEESCHISADRFAVSTTDDVMEEKLLHLFAGFERMELHLPVRVGIYSTRIEDVPVSSAYDRAKMACDELRGSDVSAFNYYSEDLIKKVRRRQYIQSGIDRAIQEKWIQVYYQPIVRAVNGRVCDEEALARWIDPEEGFLSPAEFIPQLESSGQIYKLDLYVLEQVIEKIHSQEREGLTVVPHSINLSRSDFDSCDIVEEIRRRVDEAGLARELITIEVTESVVGSDLDFMKKNVDRFRQLGFPVWMDDFGSGYSSLEVLQSIRFDLIKFDMSFMRRLDESDSARIVLKELMRMAASLDLDTVCEGVETKTQVRFLQEIGCSKLQGFYYCKPIPYEEILARYRQGRQIGFEDPESSGYYDTIGRFNLYDLEVMTGNDGGSFQHTFNTLPIGVIEVRGDEGRFVRSNSSYREFIRRAFGFDMTDLTNEFSKIDNSFMLNVKKKCCEQGSRFFFDEKIEDGSTVHSFARRIGKNPVTGETAVAVAVLSISDPYEGESYADIAGALAADYYNIYVIDLDTDNYIEYSSQVGGEEITLERRGHDFFGSARIDTMTRIYEEDRESFLSIFTKENVIRNLEVHGVFTTTYRLIDTGTPMYVNMKITRIHGGNRIIVGISIIDAHMKQLEEEKKLRQEKVSLGRIAALSPDYIVLYTVDIRTDRYTQYSPSSEFEKFGLAEQGEDFFKDVILDAPKAIDPEDMEEHLRVLTKDNILSEIQKKGFFTHHYRRIMNGKY